MEKSKLFRPSRVSNAKKFTKKRMYDDISWVEYRNKFLAENPLCYCCNKPARVVDHIVGHKGNEELFWNITNYIPLCVSHHNTITALYDKHAVPKTEEKMKFIECERQINEITRKVKIVRK